MYEEEFRVQSGDVELVGTFSFPEKQGRFPAVLMVHGSGALDRNQNSKAQRLNIFNTIAKALADCGIASFRYDKRGCGSSSGEFMQAGHSDLVQDATCCLDALMASERVLERDIYILGHSEGCAIAPQVALHRTSVSGLVLLCPFIEHFESLLLRQAERLEKEIASLPGVSGFLYRLLFKLTGSPTASQRRLVDKVRETDLPMIRHGFSRFPAKWLREMLALDAAAIFAATSTPMLLIGGEKDLQCDPEDIFRIAANAKGLASQPETHLLEGMTHLLRMDEGPATILGSARLVSRPVERAVTDKVARWILTNSMVHM